MKGYYVIAMICVTMWTPSLAVAMGKTDQVKTASPPQKKAAADVTVSRDTAAMKDDEVAKRLEMLQFMEMLEHFDLIRDLDVLEGGGK